MDLAIFFVFLATCAVAASSGVLFKPGAWYRGLDKPAWTPPNLAFPIIWSVLYLLMAIAAARVAGHPGSALALALWSLQICLNTLWSGVFFGLHRMRAAAIVIGLLWLALAATIIAFWRHDGIAAALLVPYLIWGSYAFALNLSIWRRNPLEDAGA
ncbi:MAG: tryptophan-rich sensory protein [Salinarimonas sp.]|nr:tryptophan-rich sensory protein [Salinarimonas sp.]